MKIGAAPRIMTVAVVCVAALIGLVVSEGAARRGGQEVLLAMEAVDPRSLLSGHYVQIGLSQRLEPGEHCPPPVDGDWVALRPAGETYTLAGGATSREEAQLVGPLPVKGSFECSPPTAAEGNAPGFPGWVRLELGIDRFHINQRDALRIERVLREQRPGEETRAFAIVSVGRDGRARLKGLRVDGERFELNWL
jgi:hypothetical protein